MLLSDLIKSLEKEYVIGDTNININKIAYDSRKVSENDIFVCIRGFKTDGHNYIQQAIERGAVAVVVEKDVENLGVPVVKVADSREALAFMAAKFFGYPSNQFKLIGVTGTNGKTTTTYLIKSVLEHKGYKVGLIGTNQNMIGDMVIPTERTTPESLELQQLFFDMAKEKVDYVVMEVSSHSLELNRVAGCHYEVGIFTNITQDHLDFHITMENYLKAKAKLFNMCKIGVINIDDFRSQYILDTCSCSTLCYGIDKKKDLYAENIQLSDKGVSFEVVANDKREIIELGIPGKFSVYNALASIGACLALGIDLEDIKAGLKKEKGVPGRAQLVPTGRDFSVLIDYAHTPDGLQNILSTVRDFAKGRVITVFGCGGDRDRTKRPIMGRIAGQLSDFCVITSDNPRTEDPMKIIRDIEEGIKDTGSSYVVIENRYQAIKYAITNAEKDDIIVLAGKGHETYQEINGVRYHFDENEVVREILSESMQNEGCRMENAE